MTLNEYYNELKAVLDAHKVTVEKNPRRIKLFDKDGIWLWDMVKHNGKLAYETPAWGVPDKGGQLFNDLRDRLKEIE